MNRRYQLPTTVGTPSRAFHCIRIFTINCKMTLPNELWNMLRPMVQNFTKGRLRPYSRLSETRVYEKLGKEGQS